MSSPTTTLLLTGRPGVGKTTALRRAADRLADLEIRGFYTEEVRGDRGQRTGFRALPFAAVSSDGGEDWSRLIASVEFGGSPRVSKYGVDVGAVDAVTGRHLGAADADAVLVDEIGKMECYSDRFVARMEELVAANRPVVATVARRGGGLIGRVKEAPGTRLVEVTPDNRDRMPEAIEAWVRERVA